MDPTHPNAARTCAHSAFLYETSATLCHHVAEQMADAIARGAMAVVLATDDHIAGMQSQLRELGCDVDALIRNGDLAFIEARATLKRIMLGDEPQRHVFQQAATAIIESAKSRSAQLFVYGELVNLLWARGNLQAAIQIEQWWNELRGEFDFTLVCGYRADPFDQEAQAMLEAVCATHSHVSPVENGARYDGAVDAGLQAMFPHAEVETMRTYLADQCPHTAQMPVGLATLLGLRRVLPSLADRVRLEAAWRYRKNEQIA